MRDLPCVSLDGTGAPRHNHCSSIEVIMLPILFVVFAVAFRFMPHPMMFTPVAAALLFFGARGSKRQMWIPLVMLAASDVFLTKVTYAYPFTWDHYVTWAWYAAILWLGTALHDRQRPLPVIGAALASSVSFFVISNFTVWAVWTQMYPRTFNGLLASYVAGLPFFRREVLGDLLFTTAMFATPVLIHYVAGLANKSDHTAAA
jgi:hypothetical protein